MSLPWKRNLIQKGSHEGGSIIIITLLGRISQRGLRAIVDIHQKPWKANQFAFVYTVQISSAEHSDRDEKYFLARHTQWPRIGIHDTTRDRTCFLVHPGLLGTVLTGIHEQTPHRTAAFILTLNEKLPQSFTSHATHYTYVCLFVFITRNLLLGWLLRGALFLLW